MSNNLSQQRAIFFLSSLFGIVLTLCGSSAWAAQLYRYVDDTGNTVLNSTIPPKYVGQGYDILNEKGRLIQRIAPALTPEEIKARDAELERQARIAAELAEQKKRDEELLQLYSHPDDAVRVLSRRIQDIAGVIQVKRGKIEATKKQILDQESRAAALQRKGIPVADNIFSNIKALHKDITNAEADIEELKQERSKVLEEFDEKIKRLEIITKKPSQKYQELLETLGQNTPAESDDNKKSDTQTSSET